MQTKRQSIIESAWQTVIGYICAVIIQYIVYPLYGIEIDWFINFQIAMIFMVASYIRSYYVRRFFNWYWFKNKK